MIEVFERMIERRDRNEEQATEPAHREAGCAPLRNFRTNRVVSLENYKGLSSCIQEEKWLLGNCEDFSSHPQKQDPNIQCKCL